MEPDISRRVGIGGPKTEEGKKRSSLNSLTHGARAKSPHALAAMEAASALEYQPFLDRVLSYYAPNDPIEDVLAERIARCLWRLARSTDIDARRAANHPMPSSLPGVSDGVIRYELMVDMQLHRAMRAMERKKGLRVWREKKEY